MSIGKRNCLSDGYPDEGVLCLVTFPTGKYMYMDQEKMTGHSATAYYRKNQGWVYADGEPRYLKFTPYYWHEIDVFYDWEGEIHE